MPLFNFCFAFSNFRTKKLLITNMVSYAKIIDYYKRIYDCRLTGAQKDLIRKSFRKEIIKRNNLFSYTLEELQECQD